MNGTNGNQKAELDQACANFAKVLNAVSAREAMEREIVYSKGKTLLVVRRSMVKGGK